MEGICGTVLFNIVFIGGLAIEAVPLVVFRGNLTLLLRGVSRHLKYI
jgi:hypothetical protein